MIRLGGGCCIPMFQCKLPNSTSDAEQQGGGEISVPLKSVANFSGCIVSGVSACPVWLLPSSQLPITRLSARAPGCFSYLERVSRMLELLRPGLMIFEASGILRAPSLKGEYSFRWTNIPLTLPKSTFLIPWYERPRDTCAHLHWERHGGKSDLFIAQ